MAEELKGRRDAIDVRRKRNAVEAAQRSCEAMKSGAFDNDFEFTENFNIRDEMRTLETRDDVEFELLFNPSEVIKQASLQ